MEHVSLTLPHLLHFFAPLITLTLPRELVAPSAANLNRMCGWAAAAIHFSFFLLLFFFLALLLLLGSCLSGLTFW